MLHDKRGYSTIEFLMVLGLMLLFTFGSILLIQSGSGFYDRMLKGKDSQTDARIATAYINNKLRQSDQSNGIRTESLDAGADAIVLKGGEAGEYETWIFCEEGMLREALVASGEKPVLDQTFEVIGLASMETEMLDERTLGVIIGTADGDEISLVYRIKSWR